MTTQVEPRAPLWRRLSPGLLTRVALALALVGLAPVAVLAYRLIEVNREALTDRVETSHVLAARKTAEGVGAFLETRLALVHGLAANSALADPRSTEARALLTRNLQAWAELGILALAVVDPVGEPFIVAQLSDDAVRERVAGVLADREPREVASYGTGAETRVRLQAPLAAGAGFVWLVAEGEPLLDALDAFELGEAAELTLADGSGRALQGSLEGFSPDLLAQAASGRLQGVDPSFHLGSGSDELIGAFAPVPYSDWTVFSRQPARVARAVERRMRSQSAIAVGLAAALVALLSAGAYSSVVRPIRQLAAAQRRLAGVGGDASGGGNEIDQLRASFKALETRLRQQRELDDVFLGRYRVDEVVGSGAMGTVFQAWDPKLKRPVALKTVRLDTQLAPGRRQELMGRLVDEAVMVAQFNHPHIVSVFDVEDRGGDAFVAMEFVDGESLEHFLWVEGALGIGRTAVLGARIAEALATAHAHGLVHRDVKPANIMLGKDGSIKVTDFGISELVTTISGKPDVVFGTPGYLPPEALQGLGYDRSGDLFSLGAILYYGVTGKRPFDGRSVREVVRKTLFERPVPARQLEPSCPPELDRLITELLRKEPTDRPADAASVAAELTAIATAVGGVWEPPTFRDEAPASGGSESHFVPTQRI